MYKVKQTIPLVAFCLYLVKVMVQPVGYPEALILAVLGTITLFIETRIHSGELKTLTEKVEIRQKELETYIKDIENLKSYVNSVKLGSVRNNIVGR
jgi:hypothetical protein